MTGLPHSRQDLEQQSLQAGAMLAAAKYESRDVHCTKVYQAEL